LPASRIAALTRPTTASLGYSTASSLPLGEQFHVERLTVYKRAPTRQELEQQLETLANEYGVSKNKKVFEQMLEVCRRIEVLKSKSERRTLTDHR
jgi:hypothetical protein